MNKKETAKRILKKIYKVISYVSFTLLIIIGLALVYYLLMTKIYESTQDKKYLPVFSLYTIISPSMEPAIKVYDVVVDTKVDQNTEINVGDVITFYSRVYNTNNLTVTHRVSQKIETYSGVQYVTKGDNNSREDGGFVYQGDIVGKVLFKIPQLGRVQFLVASKGGWLFIVLIPALCVIIYDVVKIFKMLKVNKKLDKIEENTKNKQIMDSRKKAETIEIQQNLKQELLEKHSDLPIYSSNETIGDEIENNLNETDKNHDPVELPKKKVEIALKKDESNSDDDIFFK